MAEYTSSEGVLQTRDGIEMRPYAEQQSLLSNQQHLALMNLIKANDPDTKNEIVARSLHIVLNVADHYRDHGVDLVNLINEGIRGLIHAMESFEHTGGFRFESYAIRCIRQSIECTIMNQMEPE